MISLQISIYLFIYLNMSIIRCVEIEIENTNTYVVLLNSSYILRIKLGQQSIFVGHLIKMEWNNRK